MWAARRGSAKADRDNHGRWACRCNANGVRLGREHLWIKRTGLISVEKDTEPRALGL